MIVSLKLGVDCNPLPPILVKLTGSDEVVLIELQGSIATTGDTAGQLVGTLSIDPANNVCIFFLPQTSLTTSACCSVTTVLILYAMVGGESCFCLGRA